MRFAKTSRKLGLCTACCLLLRSRHVSEKGLCALCRSGLSSQLWRRCSPPHQGLFTLWGSQELTTYGAAALLLICAAAVLAALSKSKSAKLSRAILTSLTALAGSGGSKGLDGALDFVFEKVFSTRMVEFTFFDVDDYI